MIYITKGEGRKQILGLSDINDSISREDHSHRNASENMVVLPTVTAGEFETPSTIANKNGSTPKALNDDLVLSDAIPITIYNEAIQHFTGSDEFAMSFFDMVAEFDGLPCQHAVLNHVLETARSQTPQNALRARRFVQLPVLGVDIASPGFPKALESALSRIKPAIVELEDISERLDLCRYLIQWFLFLVAAEALDDGIQKVLELTLTRLCKNYVAESSSHCGGEAAQPAELFEGENGKILEGIVTSTT